MPAAAAFARLALGLSAVVHNEPLLPLVALVGSFYELESIFAAMAMEADDQGDDDD